MRFGVLLVALVALILVNTSTILSPGTSAYAEGSEADAQCNPVMMECECGMVMNKETKKCEMKGQKANMHNCPCKDVTQGHVTEGKCIALNRCKGEKTDGKEPQLPKIPEMKPPEKKKDEPKQEQPKESTCDCSKTATSTPSTSSATSTATTTTSTSNSSTADRSGATTQTGVDANGNSCTCDSGSSYMASSYTPSASDSSSYYSNSYPFSNLLNDLESGTVGTGSVSTGVTFTGGGSHGAIQIVAMDGSDIGSIADGRSGSRSPAGVAPSSGSTGFSSGGDGFSSDVIDATLIGRASSLLSAFGGTVGGVVADSVEKVRVASGLSKPTTSERAESVATTRVQPETTVAPSPANQVRPQAPSTTTAAARGGVGAGVSGGGSGRAYGAPSAAPPLPAFQPADSNSGVVHVLLRSFFNGVQSIIDGVGAFARGFFGVFVQ